MGLLDGLAGQVLGQMTGGAQGQGSQLMQLALGLIQNGGLSQLLGKFQQAGLADQAASWVGTGQNMPISADQLRAALGSGAIADIAGKLGMSDDKAAGGLANVLPQLVDQLTPQGQVTQGAALQSGLAALAGKLLG
jgi:uncharacterized protein YidB (DUF937 family)